MVKIWIEIWELSEQCVLQIQKRECASDSKEKGRKKSQILKENLCILSVFEFLS